MGFLDRIRSLVPSARAPVPPDLRGPLRLAPGDGVGWYRERILRKELRDLFEGTIRPDRPEGIELAFRAIHQRVQERSAHIVRRVLESMVRQGWLTLREDSSGRRSTEWYLLSDVAIRAIRRSQGQSPPS